MAPRDCLASEPPVGGVARLRAHLYREAFTPHRHDTYTVAVTEAGVQEFGYRGAVRRSLPGQVVVLHPDELHDGRAGTPDGFAYRTLYLDPAEVAAAARAFAGRCQPLPFIRDPVLTAPALASALAGAFDGPLEPLRAEALVCEVTRWLLAAAGGGVLDRAPRDADQGALQAAHDFLEASWRRVVRSAELERVSGLDRFELCVQFRRRFGTSPHRFLVLRRLEHVQARLGEGADLAGLAAEAGFSDQAHLTRSFKAAYGLTPGRFAALHREGARRH